MAKRDQSVFESLGQMLKPPPPPKATKDKLFHPGLTGRQKQIFDSPRRFILAWGEKGCRTGDTQVYGGDGLVHLRRLMPDGAKSGFNHLETPVIAFNGSRVVTAMTQAFLVEESREAIRCELANGAEITGSPRHPIWLCAMAPDGSHSFKYMRFAEITEQLEHGWRFWTPLMAHPAWTRMSLVCVRIPAIRKECRVCGGKSVARGLCPKHYTNLVYHHAQDHPLREEVDIPLASPIAYALGALVGDGSLNFKGGKRSVAFTNKDEECIDKVRSGLESIGCILVKTGPIEFGVRGRHIKPLIAGLGLDKTSYYKRIPAQIIESPKPVVAAFLQGLFDTDGSVEKPGHVTFCTTSEGLGRDVQDILAAFGILCIRRRKKSASGRPTWALSINGSHAYRFGRDIGFAISRKQARIRDAKPSFRNPAGFNHNRYGFPEPIKTVWRTAWRTATISKTRANNYRNKRLCSFGSVPARHKLNEIIAAFGSAELFNDFLVSDNWLEINKTSPCEAELFDLDVCEHESFLASGTINHNSGKSIGCLHKVVRHCYENENALAVILVRVRSMANKGGAWDKLQSMVLPEWRSGLGLDYSEVKFDSQHNEFLWVQNEYGGWSMIVLISAPHANQLRDRIRGYEPSIVFVDELTSCDSVEYFQAIAAQIGRRPFVDGVQQYIAACNPEGPSHWVYQKWFVQAFNEETGEWDPDFENIHFPIAENAGNLQPGYLDSLKKIFRDDKVEGARMLGGEWVDRPSGEGLFRDLFNIVTHVRPLNDEMQPNQFDRLLPVKGHTMVIGLDPGAVNSGFSFEQWLPIEERMKWLIFDELTVIKQKLAYEVLIPMVMRRVKFWRETTGADLESLPQAWISDNSAFNQYRAAQGSYDVLEIERIYEANREKYGLEPMKIRPAPKFNGSVVTRVRLTQKHLAAGEIIVSSGCPAHIRMFMQLEGKKNKPGEVPDPEASMTPQRSDHVHLFDAFSYPLITAALNPTMLVPNSGRTQQLISAA